MKISKTKHYPYNEIEISEIEFIKIDDRHYGDG